MNYSLSVISRHAEVKNFLLRADEVAPNLYRDVFTLFVKHFRSLML
jgi:hypothetical protein